MEELEQLAVDIQELLEDIDRRVATTDRSEYTQGYIDALIYVLTMIEEVL